MAFRSARHERDRRIYCEDCAAELGIKAVDSKRMLAARQLQLST